MEIFPQIPWRITFVLLSVLVPAQSEPTLLSPVVAGHGRDRRARGIPHTCTYSQVSWHDHLCHLYPFLFNTCDTILRVYLCVQEGEIFVQGLKEGGVEHIRILRTRTDIMRLVVRRGS